MRTHQQLDPAALEQRVALAMAEEQQTPDTRSKAWRGFSAESVTFRGAPELEFKWAGSTHYLATHDIQLADGEISLGDDGPVRLKDLRERITFMPEGCGVSGWSRLARRKNTFTTLYYDPAILPEELDTRLAGIERPMLYFKDPGLQVTLEKIQSVLLSRDPIDAIYGETLGLTAAIELARLQFDGPGVKVPDSGRLGPGQEKRVLEFIGENLHRDISLTELAGVVSLSRFHFTRSFRRTTGFAPHQFILSARVERAKELLVASDTTMLDLSQRVGFGSQAQFSAAFRRLVGMTPSQFRRDRK